MSCSAGYDWAESPDFSGPLGLDYCYLYQAVAANASIVAILLLLVWIMLLMSLLAQTASNYFSPTLSTICDKLRLPYDIAGVTFLALGNGAPDFFSLVASFSGGVDVLVGVGALLGGSMFVCTVVVGSIAILCPCDVSKKLFLRDISFHIAAVLLVVAISVVEHVTLGLAISLIAFYLVYVGIVIFTSLTAPASGEEDSVAGDMSMRVMNNNAAIQTAFWHPLAPTAKSKKKHKKAEQNNDLEQYSFMIIQDKSGDDALGDDDNTINLTGGFAPCFDDIIMEDHYDAQAADSSPRVGQADVESEGLGMESTLERSLLDREAPTSDASAKLGTIRHLRARNSQAYNNVLTSLYWQQWALRRRFQHPALSAEWEGYSFVQKALVILEYPITVARDLTIPTLDEGSWNKLYAMVHPIADPLFACYIFGLAGNVVETLIMCVLMGAIPSFCIFLVAPNNKPPTAPFFVVPWTLTAFVMCVAWVYMLAGELITALSVLGIILKLPPAFLGLTILAWGNSVGDFFTNTAVAKQGLGAMALAGCYAGPVFNILVGFGTSLVYASSQTYPESFKVRLDASSKLSLAFLVVALSSSVGIVAYSGFKLERGFGMYLLSLYAVYSACQGLLVLLDR